MLFKLGETVEAKSANQQWYVKLYFQEVTVQKIS